MRFQNLIYILPVLFVVVSCVKEDYPRVAMYDPYADVDRNYTLEFDHIEVVNEESTTNVNGLLDVVEVATLRVYIKNNGPDPCVLKEGTFEDIPSINGFYIKNKNIGTNGGFKIGNSEEIGYVKQYIDPGTADYIDVDVRTYASLDPNQDIACVFMLTDYDGKTHQVDFSVHVE